MSLRTRTIDDAWRCASLDQIADLHVWLYQRLSDRDADAVARWVLAVNSGGRIRASRRRIRAFREILDGYGPPRVAGDPSL